MSKSGAPLSAETEIDSELVIGLVAAIGTEVSLVVSSFEQELSRAGYKTVHIKESSDVIPNLQNVDTNGEAEYERIDRLMTAGNHARKAASANSENEDVGNAILAYGAAAQIFAQRETDSDGKPVPFTQTAFIIDSLKRPEEVETLRRIYPQGFILIGVDSARTRRFEHLTETLQMSKTEAENLMSRDENEATESHGQRVSKSFHLADFFVRLTNSDALRYEVRRMVELWFGCPTHTPTFDEFAMFLAFSAALRSADLSRQVGAVVALDNQVIGTGANDSPRAGGGLYWPTRDENGEFKDKNRGRDYTRGGDSNREEQVRIIDEIVSRAEEFELDTDAVRNLLERSRIRDLTEFGRVVHAEMEAILSCGRRGISTVGAEIFCTTFPCHNCAKHIIDAGLKRVVYIEPYAKSKALEFHDDSIIPPEEEYSEDETRVRFEPFSGIGPRRFYDLFSMHLSSGYDLDRKDNSTGKAIHWNIREAPLRLSMKPISYIDLEMQASHHFNDKLPDEATTGDN
ncbi:hypothetical protein AB833_18035 [Chromatiales bacterium (ex Bugula neritina AB1)]|nr:hypothetical protein AB833_18035 [Chromatiales bacterium (ex Bugula neritina AB1)]